MGLIGACLAVKGGRLVQAGTSGFVFGTSGSSWGRDERTYSRLGDGKAFTDILGSIVTVIQSIGRV